MPSSVQLRQQQHLLAVAVISRLHRWCVQLFWMTVLCVIGVVGDEKSTFSFEFLPHRYVQNGPNTGSGNGAVKLRKRHTLADIENKVGNFFQISFSFIQIILLLFVVLSWTWILLALQYCSEDAHKLAFSFLPSKNLLPNFSKRILLIQQKCADKNRCVYR